MKVNNRIIAEMFGYETYNGYVAHLCYPRNGPPRLSWEKVRDNVKWSKLKPKMTEKIQCISRRYRVSRGKGKNFTDIPQYLKNDRLVRKLMRELPVDVTWDHKKQEFMGSYHYNEDGNTRIFHTMANTFNEAFFGVCANVHKQTGLIFKEK